MNLFGWQYQMFSKCQTRKPWMLPIFQSKFTVLRLHIIRQNFTSALVESNRRNRPLLWEWRIPLDQRQYKSKTDHLLGPYGKLWTDFFPSFHGSSAKRTGHENKEEKKGYTTCRTDRANEANKMIIIWLYWLFRERNEIICHFDKSKRSIRLLRPITAREISQPYNKTKYC